MNTTFRRFVLSPRASRTSTPSKAPPTRVPGTAVAGTVPCRADWHRVVLLVTQREMFNATLATLSTVVAAVPILFRVVALVTGKRAADLEIPKV